MSRYRKLLIWKKKVEKIVKNIFLAFGPGASFEGAGGPSPPREKKKREKKREKKKKERKREGNYE